jgi:hypothetical protein
MLQFRSRSAGGGPEGAEWYRSQIDVVENL